MADQTSTIPVGWKKTTLGEVADRIGDGLHGTPEYDESGDYYFVNGNNIYEGRILIKGDTNKVNKLEYSKYKKELSERTVLISLNGTVGNLAKYNNEKCILGKSAGYINVNINNSTDYIYYVFLNREFQNHISKNANGSTIKNVSLAQLREYSLLLPSLKEQNAIAAVLTSLDDKIELLREQNKTLEAIAQAIFKEWFVYFNFPGSTGKMIDSELGEIPEGWRSGKMEEVVSIRGGTTPSTQNRNYWDGDIYWTSPKDLSNSKGIFLLNTEKKITEEGIKQISSGLLPIKTLLLSSRAPIGYLAITNINVAINQGYIAFLPDQYFSTYFMYLWLKLNMQTVIGSANGSTFMEISKSSFRNIECIIPEESVLRKFNTTTESMFNKILSNVLQIETLANLRDSLLPRLMKGELRVKGFNN